MSLETVRAFREKVQKANEVAHGVNFPLERTTEVYSTHQPKETDSLEESER